MSALKHVKGDLLKLAAAGEFDIVMHGCNCFNIMGAGIAKQIKDRYPEAWSADGLWSRSPIERLGNWTNANVRFGKDIGAPFVIINAYTQYKTASAPGEDVFEYSSFTLILKKLASLYPSLKFGLPYIGMGLAGGDSPRIIAMIEQFADKVSATGGSVTLVEYQP